MTMASLSASLLARKGDARPANRVQEMFVPRNAPQARAPLPIVPAKAKNEPTTLPKARQTSAATKSAAADRKQKSLRLERETDRALRMLAARDGVTQQSLMEAAVKALIEEKSDETGCVCGRSIR
ncbi:hypothetical protein [Kordiimonas sp.]|uniref:hypothetical protein n=1 Tax=Kordiimonas sp. TaxID=1970157 RepID=UPI003A8CAFDC